MKNVLLLVHDDAGEEARLQAAIDLTRALSGHLSCLDIVEMPVLAGADYVPDAELMLLADARERESANAARIKKQLAVEDISWSWLDSTGFMGPLIQDAAGLADIIVLNTVLPDQMTPEMRPLVSDTVMKTGKPVFAVPAAVRSVDFAGHALVAWDGSPPATQALRAAVPLLMKAQGVTILEIGDTGGDSVEDAAAYLSRHDIHARVDRDDVLEEGVAATLLTALKQRRPAYCVMGAFGHSRLRESLFGGVTRGMLTNSPVPLLIGH